MNDPVKDTNNEIDAIDINKQERRQALHFLTHGKAVYIASFIIPILIMIGIFVDKNIFPFGHQCYLRSDMYHQYCPFFSELWNKIRHGESLYYSWNIGMGTNYLAVFGYYLSSPTNWFIALFPQKAMIEIMNVIIVLKIAGSSFTCTYYLCKHNKRHLTACIFGLFYGLSAFIAAYSWNLMWLDCVVLLPLIFLGLEKLVKEGKGLLYVITLGLAILSNYYIAIMICISLVFYFIALMVSRPVYDDKIDYLRTFLKFVLYSLLAGGLAATLLFPEMAALSYTASGKINFPETWTRYYSFITIIERHLIEIPVTTGLDHLPNIYCGVSIFLLVPLYMVNKKITTREKVMKILLIVVFYTAFNLNKLNFIWHGFHFPNSLPCRQSFIYILIVLCMSYDALTSIKKYSKKELFACFAGVIALMIYLGNFFESDKQVFTMDFKAIYTSVLFLSLYLLIYCMIRHPKINADIMVLVLVALSIAEVTINMSKTGYSTTDRPSYLSDYEQVEYLTDAASKDAGDTFYRISKYRGYRTKNDDAWHNFKGASVFSSTAYAALTDFYDDLGLEHSFNAYAINGATPLIYSTFGIKYLISNRIIYTEDGLFTFLTGQDGNFIYRNNYALPVAYMIPSDFNEKFNQNADNNPFNIQNKYAESMAGVHDLFTRIVFDDYSASASLDVTSDGYYYFYVMNKTIESVSVTVDEQTQTYYGINHGRTIDVGFLKAGSKVNITNSKGANLQMYAYQMDAEKYKQVVNALSDEGLNVTSYDTKSLKGTIDVKEDGLLFTSIPYDKGWTVYVDGKKTSYTSIGDKAFIGLNLSAGTHKIEFKYYPDGLKKGRLLSILCLLVVIGFIVFRVKFKQEITEEGSIDLLSKEIKKISDKRKDKK